MREARKSSHAGLWFVLILLLIAAGAGGYWYWSHRNAQASQATEKTQSAQGRTVPVVAVQAKKGDLDLYVDNLGTATALNTVTVRPRVDGELIKVAYNEGQQVKQGDLLAEIDPRPFEAALAQAQGQLAKDQALLRNAQLDLERFKNASETLTKQQIDTQAALVQQDEGIVKTDQAAVQNAQLQLSYCRISAPISGKAGLRLVDVGNLVHANDVGGIVVLTQLQPISVVFSITQDELERVLPRANAGQTFTIDALDQDLKTRLATGTLLAIDNQIDPNTDSVKLKGLFANTDLALFPNQFVNARLHVETLHDVVTIPSAGVQRGATANATFADIVKPDHTIEMRTVTPGATEGERTVITSGLNPGEMVVIDGVDKLQQGSKVTVSAPGAATQSTTNAGRSTTSAPARNSNRRSR
jgi:multidrug efflux system membrane fusion protein